ncbi:MAG: hypothetical protein ACFFB0_05630 [Promethearchaeota archaeon]
MYESISYEEHVESTNLDDKEECQTCYKVDFDNLRILYIKREKNEDINGVLEELI